MRLLVLGAYGMLGHVLFNQLNNKYDVLATARAKNDSLTPSRFNNGKIINEIDAFDFRSIESTIERLRPEVIINCIGLIKQLSSSSDPVSMMYLNSVFPHKLAYIANEHDARLIHFSTDCIFSGKKGMYKTTDASDAEDLYGKTKFLGELPYKNCLTIRSSIIGPELGTKNGLLEWFFSQKGKTIKGYERAIYSGFTTLEMSRIVSMVLDRHPYLHGVWQVASEPISKFNLLSLINEKMNLCINIEPDFTFACNRSLDGKRFAELTGYKAPSWVEMIDELVNEFSIKS